MQLKPRLAKVFDLIQPCATIADIGTDHGYLPIALVTHCKVQHAYALDINHQPLQAARHNITQAQLTNRITTVQSDGFRFFNQHPEICLNYITICGLGSATILAIIQNMAYYRCPIIICSNTDVVNLRTWLLGQNMKITHEDFVLERDNPYWIMCIDPMQTSTMHTSDLQYGCHTFFYKNADYIHFLSTSLRHDAILMEHLLAKQLVNQATKLKRLIQQKEQFLNAIK